MSAIMELYSGKIEAISFGTRYPVSRRHTGAVEFVPLRKTRRYQSGSNRRVRGSRVEGAGTGSVKPRPLFPYDKSDEPTRRKTNRIGDDGRKCGRK